MSDASSVLVENGGHHTPPLPNNEHSTIVQQVQLVHHHQQQQQQETPHLHLLPQPLPLCDDLHHTPHNIIHQHQLPQNQEIIDDNTSSSGIIIMPKPCEPQQEEQNEQIKDIPLNGEIQRQDDEEAKIVGIIGENVVPLPLQKKEPEDYNEYSDEEDEFEGEVDPEEPGWRSPRSNKDHNCANCGEPLPEEEPRTNFHEFLPAEDMADVEVIDAISEVFKLGSKKYEKLYKRSDLFLCYKCVTILTEMYTLFRQFSDLATESLSFLSSSIVAKRESKRRGRSKRIIFSEESSDNGSDGEEIELNPYDVLDQEVDKKPNVGNSSNNTTTSSKVHGTRHKRIHSSSTPNDEENTTHRCPEAQCNKVFSRRKLLNRHVKTHWQPGSGESPGECDRCGKKFNTLGGLKIHYAAHIRDDKKFVCRDCGKKFRKAEALDLHERRDHKGFKPYTCSHVGCDKSFRLKDKLKLHIMVIHDKRKPFPCPKCEKAFRTKYHLKIHDVSQHIQGGDNSIGCSQCKRKFPDREALEKHAVIHDQDKTFVCNTCNKGFQTAARLKLHEKSHQDVPTCLCPVCGRAYKHVRDLRLHEVMHQDESTYRFGCGDCNRRFYRIDLLRVHQSNEKHFSPEIIGPTVTKLKPAVENATYMDVHHQQQQQQQHPSQHQAIHNNQTTPLIIPPQPVMPDDDDEDDYDDNETDSGDIPPPSIPLLKKKFKSMSTPTTPTIKNRKQNILHRERDLTIMHPQTAVVYHPSMQFQLQQLSQQQQNAVSSRPSSVRTHSNSSSSAYASPQQRPDSQGSAASYYISQRDRPNIVHHHPGIQIQGVSSSGHTHVQLGNQTIYTNAINMSNIPGASEHIGFDFINSFMNNLG